MGNQLSNVTQSFNQASNIVSKSILHTRKLKLGSASNAER